MQLCTDVDPTVSCPKSLIASPNARCPLFSCRCKGCFNSVTCVSTARLLTDGSNYNWHCTNIITVTVQLTRGRKSRQLVTENNVGRISDEKSELLNVKVVGGCPWHHGTSKYWVLCQWWGVGHKLLIRREDNTTLRTLITIIKRKDITHHTPQDIPARLYRCMKEILVSLPQTTEWVPVSYTHLTLPTKA